MQAMAQRMPQLHQVLLQETSSAWHLRRASIQYRQAASSKCKNKTRLTRVHGRMFLRPAHFALALQPTLASQPCAAASLCSYIKTAIHNRNRQDGVRISLTIGSLRSLECAAHQLDPKLIMRTRMAQSPPRNFGQSHAPVDSVPVRADDAGTGFAQDGVSAKRGFCRGR